MAQTVRKSKRPEPERLSYDDFLKNYNAGEHLEWVDGAVIPMRPVTKQHEDVRGFLYTIINEYVKMKQLGQVSGEPYNMKISYRLPGRAPDILFVANANLARMKDTFLDGPADLVVEVLSPRTRRTDRQVKFKEYEQGGVREYWMIEPKRRETAFYARDANGVYQPVAPDANGIYHSAALPGFWLDTNWLWQNPQPTLLSVLQAWGLA